MNFISAMATIAPYLLPALHKNRLAILIYHRVHAMPDSLFPEEVTAEIFEWQMELLSKYFNPLGLTEALELMAQDSLPEKAVAVTFDDGYADNLNVALPILKRWDIPATIFIASGFLNGGCMWNDRVIEGIRHCQLNLIELHNLGLGSYPLHTEADKRNAAIAIINQIKYWEKEKREAAASEIATLSPGKLPDDLMLTDIDVKNLHNQGIEIGSHTVTHPICLQLPLESVKAEIVENREYLENLTGQLVSYFAYPNGVRDKDYDESHCQLVEHLGFEAAFSTNWGVCSKESDIWQLPRFTPWDRTPSRFTARLLLNYRNTA